MNLFRKEIKMILEQIKTEQKKARLNKDKFRASVLTTLLAEVQSIGKNAGQRDTTDQESQQRVTKFLRNLKETFKIYTGYTTLDEWYDTTYSGMGYSEEKLDKIHLMLKEADIYREFLPKQLSTSELSTELKSFITSNPNAQMGQVMGHFSKNFKGQYDGKVLSGLVKGTLSL